MGGGSTDTGPEKIQPSRALYTKYVCLSIHTEQCDELLSAGGMEGQGRMSDIVQ